MVDGKVEVARDFSCEDDGGAGDVGDANDDESVMARHRWEEDSARVPLDRRLVFLYQTHQQAWCWWRLLLLATTAMVLCGVEATVLRVDSAIPNSFQRCVVMAHQLESYSTS